jgi:hypothetical protein
VVHGIVGYQIGLLRPSPYNTQNKRERPAIGVSWVCCACNEGSLSRRSRSLSAWVPLSQLIRQIDIGPRLSTMCNTHHWKSHQNIPVLLGGSGFHVKAS